jgi:hypothetical protein
MSFGRFFCCIAKNSNKVSSSHLPHGEEQSPSLDQTTGSTKKWSQTGLSDNEVANSLERNVLNDLQTPRRKESSVSQHSQKSTATTTVFYRFPQAQLANSEGVNLQDLKIALAKFFDGETTANNVVVPGCTITGIAPYDLMSKDEMFLSACIESHSYHAFLELEIAKSTPSNQNIRFTMNELVSIRDFGGNVIYDNEEIINGNYLIQDGTKTNGFFSAPKLMR